MKMSLSEVGGLILDRKEYERLQTAANKVEKVKHEQEKFICRKREQNPSISLFFKRGRDEELIPVCLVDIRQNSMSRLMKEEARAARLAKDEAAAREWRLHFWARDGVKQLHSALKLSEVIREREEQKEILQIRRKKEQERIDELNRQERERVRKEREKEKQLKYAIAMKQEQLKAALRTQIIENELKKIEETEMIKREKEEMLSLYQKYCEEVEQEKLMVDKKQQDFIKDFVKSTEEMKSIKRLEAHNDELEKKLCDIVLESKHKIRDELEKERKKALEEKMEKRHKKAEELYQKYQEHVKKEEEKARKRHLEIKKKEIEILSKLKNEEEERRRKAYELKEFQVKAAKEKLEEKIKSRSKSAEKKLRQNHSFVTKTYTIQQLEHLRNTQKKNLKTYAKQVEAKEQEEHKEQIKEIATVSRQRIENEMEDRQFLNYAKKVIKDAENLSRPLLPLFKTVQKYKDKFKIDKEPFIKESMRSHFISHNKCKSLNELNY